MANHSPTNGFKKGQSGNPHGRPKAEWTMRGEYIKALERQTADGTPMKQGVAEALIDKAIQGDVLAIKELGNRIDGMPVQKQVLSGDEEHPVSIDIGNLLTRIYGSDSTQSTDKVS